MSAVVQIDGYSEQATCNDYCWRSENSELETKLTELTIDHEFGPSGADPNPDLTCAQKAVDLLGGRIVSYKASQYIPGRVY